ncbi:MAG TPA: hypothetical protein VHU84_03720, partial [Lacipirellulaceae bacterium]|nr:hypothetical protein [Lacipirellulaceae bacterium]
MARQSRGRLRLGRIFSPRSKSASAVASVQAQQKRRKARMKKWRERFKRFSLSSWHESAIVATVCNLFKTSAATARALREATGSQIVGPSYGRQLRIEGLEARQMLSVNMGTGGVYFENFDTTLSATSAATWSSTAGTQAAVPGTSGWDGVKLSGTGGTSMNYTVDNGSANAGAIYSYGTTAAADRALGSVASASNIAAFGVEFVNTSGSTINSLTIAYRGEFWRSSTTTQNTLTFAYTVGASGSTNYLTASGETASSALNLVGPSPVTTNGALDGNALGNNANFSATLNGLSWANGQSLYLRWQDKDDTGSDAGLAVDNFALVVNTPTTTYVDDAWTGFTNGQVITDADAVTAGNQPAIFGTNAFATLQSAMTAVASGGTVVVNDGTYAEAIGVDAGKTMKVIGNVSLNGNDLTVNGTLQVDGSLSGAGTVIATSGGKIGGTGAITATTVRMNSGAKLGPGDSPGALTVNGNVLFKSGSTFEVEINGTSTPSHDLLTVNNGNVTIESNVTLSPILGYTPATGDSVNILHHTGTGIISGSFSYSKTAGFKLSATATDETLLQNQAPVFTPNTTPSTAENSTAVESLTATDPDNDTVTISITGGADASAFVVNAHSGAFDLSFASAPDFEARADANQDNVYEVEVTADDGQGGLTKQTISV